MPDDGRRGGGPRGDGLAKGGPADKGPADDGLTDNGPSHDGPSHDGPSDDGPAPAAAMPAAGAPAAAWVMGAPAAGGTVRAVVLHPDPVLRAVCAPAAALRGADLRALVADLFATLYHARGRGLAAPQIGVTRRVFVMDAGWKAGAPSPLAALDPRILWRSPATEEAEEICLSIPGRPVQVRRAAAIRLAFADAEGARHEIALEGAAARIAQHELDHLDGVLILDAPSFSDALPSGPGA